MERSPARPLSQHEPLALKYHWKTSALQYLYLNTRVLAYIRTTFVFTLHMNQIILPANQTSQGACIVKDRRPNEILYWLQKYWFVACAALHAQWSRLVPSICQLQPLSFRKIFLPPGFVEAALSHVIYPLLLPPPTSGLPQPHDDSLSVISRVVTTMDLSYSKTIIDALSAACHDAGESEKIDVDALLSKPEVFWPNFDAAELR